MDEMVVRGVGGAAQLRDERGAVGVGNVADNQVCAGGSPLRKHPLL